MTIQEQLAAQYRLLGHEGLGLTEFRVITMKSGSSDVLVKAYAANEMQFLTVALSILEKQDVGTGVFVGLNPRKQSGVSAKDNISHLTMLMIDIDPVRPTGAASTNEQHTEAITLGRNIFSDIHNSILVDSGSGCHIYLPIDPIKVENPVELTKQCKAWSDEIIKKYETPKLKIDSVYDLPRVTRLWGSFNHKSKRFVTPILTEIPATFPRSEFNVNSSQQTNTEDLVERSSVGEQTRTRFTQLVRIHPGLSSIMSGKADFKSPSESNYAFVTYLTKAHFTTEEIKELVRLNPMMEGTQKNDAQIDADVERIVGKVRNNGIGSTSLIHSGNAYFDRLKLRTPGVSSGFKGLDEKLGGFQKGKMYVVAARTNEGKTTLCTQLASTFAGQGLVTLFFPTELGYEPVFDKILSNRTGISLKRFQFGSFTEEENKTITLQKDEAGKIPLIVVEDFSLTTEAIESKIKDTAPDILIVDYLQSMRIEQDGGPKEIAERVNKIREITNRYNTITLLASQLSRAAIGTELSLGQLKGSGAIEEMADAVLALTTLDKLNYPRPCDLHILKSRYSEVGRVRLNFYSTIGKFVEADNV